MSKGVDFGPKTDPFTPLWLKEFPLKTKKSLFDGFSNACRQVQLQKYLIDSFEQSSKMLMLGPYPINLSWA